MSHKIEELFPELKAIPEEGFAALGTSKPTLMIAMTARTGSTHLCSALASAMEVGNPIELFNARDVLIWEKTQRKAGSYSELLNAHYNESRDYFMFKTNWIDFKYFSGGIFHMFPRLKIIYLNRLDIEAQAVSVVKAIKTGVWHNSVTLKNAPRSAYQEVRPQFNLVEICQHIRSLEREKASWESFFFKNELEPVRLNYEDFSQDVKLAVARIAKVTGITIIDPEKIRSTFKVMADDVNEDWIRRIKDYRNGLDIHR